MFNKPEPVSNSMYNFILKINKLILFFINNIIVYNEY